MGTQFTVFLGISILVILSPGPDFALVTRNTLVGVRRTGIFTSLGVVTGLGIWSVAAAFGLAALLGASEPAFVAVKLIGAAYLTYLGLHALYGALLAKGSRYKAGEADERRRIAPSTAYRQGVISNLGNPKIAVFFTSLLPQFAPHGGSFLALLYLGLSFCLLTLLWLTICAVIVAKAGDFLRQPRIRRTIDGLTGAVLLGFGLRLATEHR